MGKVKTQQEYSTPRALHEKLTGVSSNLNCRFTSTQDGVDWKIYSNNNESLCNALNLLGIKFTKPEKFSIYNVDFDATENDVRNALSETFMGVVQVRLFKKRDKNKYPRARHSGTGQIIFCQDALHNSDVNAELVASTADGGSYGVRLPYLQRISYLRLWTKEPPKKNSLKTRLNVNEKSPIKMEVEPKDVYENSFHQSWVRKVGFVEPPHKNRFNKLDVKNTAGVDHVSLETSRNQQVLIEHIIKKQADHDSVVKNMLNILVAISNKLGIDVLSDLEAKIGIFTKN